MGACVNKKSLHQKIKLEQRSKENNEDTYIKQNHNVKNYTENLETVTEKKEEVKHENFSSNKSQCPPNDQGGVTITLTGPIVDNTKRILPDVDNQVVQGSEREFDIKVITSQKDLKSNNAKNQNMTLENLIEEDDGYANANGFEFKQTKCHEPLYYLVDCYVTNSSQFSSEEDWTQVLRKAKYQSKSQLAVNILSLKERRWNKENIALSDMIKESRESNSLDSFLLIKFLNARLKLQEHFNWFLWAVSYFYQVMLFSPNTNTNSLLFNNEEFGFPPLEHIDWIKGFEYKGVYLRVQTENQSDYLYREVKALNYAFIEYVQIIDTFRENVHDPLLSNEIIFPIISYSKFCGMTLLGSVCINKYNYDMTDNNISMNKQSERILSNIPNTKLISDNMQSLNDSGFNCYVKYKNSSNKQNLTIPYDLKPIQTQHKEIHHTGNHHPSERNKMNAYPQYYEISNIENNSLHSLNLSNNINKDINLNLFSLQDFRDSKIFSQISSRNIINVLNDMCDNEGNVQILPKCKLMLCNALDLIPDLYHYRSNFIYLNKEDNTFFNEDDYDEKLRINEKFGKLDDLVGHFLNYGKVLETDGVFEKISFKIFHIEGSHNKTIRVNDYFTHINSKNVNSSLCDMKLLGTLPKERQDFIRNFFLSGKEIKGKTIIGYKTEQNMKLKYSLIRNYPFSPDEANFRLYLENFCKVLDSNISIQDKESLKEYYHRFGINSSLDIFILPKIKNKNISDLIKINLLTKLCRKFINFNEGLNFLYKIHLININISLGKPTIENLSILNDGFYDCIKESSLSEIRRQKIYYAIMSIFKLSEIPFMFSNHFYENLGILLFYKTLKWRTIDNSLGLGFFEQNSSFTQSTLLMDLISTAERRPFLFLNSLELSLGFSIDPLVKFQASLSLSHFLSKFTSDHIRDTDPSVTTFLNGKELSYYLLAKSLRNDPSSKAQGEVVLSNRNTSTKETNMTNTLNTKHNIQNPPNSFKSKANIVTYTTKLYHNSISNTSLIKTISNNIRTNSNNITTIDMINNKYISNRNTNNKATNVNHPGTPSKIFDTEASKSVLSADINADEVRSTTIPIHQARIWENLSKEFDLVFPSLLYKMKYKADEKVNTNRKEMNYYKYLRPNYSLSKIEYIKDWKSKTEMLLNDIVSLNSDEFVLCHCYILLFVNSFFIETDYNLCKDIIFRLREMMKNILHYKFPLLAIVNLLEGLITERKNYIDCEQFYSKCLVFSLLTFGDPRGRGNTGSSHMLFPLWKLSRQTCILENSLTNENFKEMFHTQDFIFKNLIENEKNSSIENTLFNPHLSYDKTMKHQLEQSRIIAVMKRTSSHVNLSEVNFDEDINENQSIISRQSRLRNNHGHYQLSERNFESQRNKNRYFPFPSVSDVRTSYNSYFCSEYFLLFLLKNILNVLGHGSLQFDEEYLAKLNLNCYSWLNTSVDFIAKTSGGSVKSGKSIIKKDKNSLFSSYMYDFLLDKINYKKFPPDGTVIAWGSNTHNETSHNNIDFLSLPRVCYKIKETEVVKLSCGWEHNVVISKEQDCYAWGNSKAGQCGVESAIVFNPSKIKGIENAVQVSCGNDHNLVLVEGGAVYSWGRSEDGVLGIDGGNSGEIVTHPTKVATLKNCIAIASGTIHNLVLTSDGSVYSWGCSKGGQLGLSENHLLNIPGFTGYVAQPFLIESLRTVKVIKISCGEAHSLALTSEGQVYGWGFTSNGQLGLGFCEDSFEPGTGMINSRVLQPRLIDFKSTGIIDIQCGKTFSMFITFKNELYACGVNDLYQLGIELSKKHSELKCSDVVWPTPVECFLNMKVRKVSCGESHCIALIEDLMSRTVTLWSWGSNRFGQLGQGNEVKKSLPKPINYMLGYTNCKIIDIACGAYHSLCLISSGKGHKGTLEEKKFLDKIINNYSNKWN